MIPYRGYHYARKRRPGTFAIYWEISRDGKYISYADTVAEAKALIDRYCDQAAEAEHHHRVETAQPAPPKSPGFAEWLKQNGLDSLTEE